MSGCCGLFAVELSKAFGYPILGFVDEEEFVCHFCCLSPDGLIDAKGKKLSIEEVSESYVHQGQLRLEPFTVEEVESSIQENASLGALDPPGYREALRYLFQDSFWQVWQESGRDYIYERVSSEE